MKRPRPVKRTKRALRKARGLVRRARLWATRPDRADGECHLEGGAFSAPKYGWKWRTCSICGEKTPQTGRFCCWCGAPFDARSLQYGDSARRRIEKQRAFR